MNPRAGIRLDDGQRLDWLRLSRTEGVGPRTFRDLVNRFGGARAALENLPDLARARGRAIRIPDPAEIDAEMRAARRAGIRLVASGEEDYPPQLLTIEGPPPVLAIRGRAECFTRPAIGVVGARNASAQGRRMAMRLAGGFAEAGYVVVSGLARGIDTEAHRASLEQGTIAVLAGGLDRPYPPENAGLCDEIAEKGAIVSEMPLGLSPRGRDFPRRNRLISGLSCGIVVVEAARRSGSLITARMAAEQGREVFAVPGSPLDPRCEGTNDLLREGATIVTAAEDVLITLAPMAGMAGRAPRLFREPALASREDMAEEWADSGLFAVGPDAMEGGEMDLPGEPDPAPALRLLELLSLDPVEIDHLARMSGLDSRAVQALLAEFELQGLVSRHPGNRVARVLERLR